MVILDDRPIFREGLRRLLERETDLKVIGEASDTAEAVKLVRRLKPDILTTDLARPKDSGFETLRRLRSTRQRVKVIVLTAAMETTQIIDALQLGARGIVLKDSATQGLTEAIRRVRDGKYWVRRESFSNLGKYLRTLKREVRQDVEQQSKKFRLTPRELEIVSVVVKGTSGKQMTEYLKISEDTVKHHLSNIFDKLGVSTRLELALFAVNHGLPLKWHEPKA